MMDLESESCWPDGSALPNKSPGVRVVLGANGTLAVERGKIGFADATFRSTFLVPRDKWFDLSWVLKLSTTDDGMTSLSVDGTTVLSSPGINMPSPSVFAGYGLTLDQPVVYDRIQVGITATSQAATIYADNMRIAVE
jgi:hypothetical protein